MKLSEGEIKFDVNGKPVAFKIVHNLGESIVNAVNNWVYRTTEHTAQSLIEYIESKNEDFIAMTPEQYNNITI